MNLIPEFQSTSIKNLLMSLRLMNLTDLFKLVPQTVRVKNVYATNTANLNLVDIQLKIQDFFLELFWETICLDQISQVAELLMI